jgi:redox-sensing transcriptional repressor
LRERDAVARRGLPAVTVDRLVHCYRLCRRLRDAGREFVSSQEIGERLGYSASQVRKDFSMLGRLGRRGSGYGIADLESVLGRILGKGRSWEMVLVGAGNLGRALLSYGGFERQGFHFVAVFDADPEKVGAEAGGLVVRDVAEVPEVVRSTGVEIGVIAVPARAAQWVAATLSENGVRAILNFAPSPLRPGAGLAVSNVDLAVELEKLCYYLAGSRA